RPQGRTSFRVTPSLFTPCNRVTQEQGFTQRPAKAKSRTVDKAGHLAGKSPINIPVIPQNHHAEVNSVP
ncbi:MAG: hypothetical protein VYE28_04230, partial [Planctomycetota bacterium]|nr:hypothetical protein [Planctomycetota bacterium]